MPLRHGYFGGGGDDATYTSFEHRVIDFFADVQATTLSDLDKNHNVNLLLTNAIEELGEYANALTVEQGYKQKELKESSKEEAVDVVICALALFYARGGTLTELVDYGTKKLEKWKGRLKKTDALTDMADSD